MVFKKITHSIVHKTFTTLAQKWIWVPEMYISPNPFLEVQLWHVSGDELKLLHAEVHLSSFELVVEWLPFNLGRDL